MRKIFCFLIISLFCVNLYAEKYHVPDSIIQKYCRNRVDSLIKDIEVINLIENDKHMEFCLSYKQPENPSLLYKKINTIDYIIRNVGTNLSMIKEGYYSIDKHVKEDKRYYDGTYEKYIKDLKAKREKIFCIIDSVITNTKNLKLRCGKSYIYEPFDDSFKVYMVVSKSQLQKMVSDNIISKEDAANLKPRKIERNYDDNITIIRTPRYVGGRVTTRTSWY